MSDTGLEQKVENMNVDEKEPKDQKGGKDREKVKGGKKKKDDHSSFPLEVSFFHARLSACYSLTRDKFLVHLFCFRFDILYSFIQYVPLPYQSYIINASVALSRGRV